MSVEKDAATNVSSSQVDENQSKDDTVSLPKQGLATTLREICHVNNASQGKKHLYITGLRGFLTIQSFLWTFFWTFIPTLASSRTPGPLYQTLLRDILSVPFWNESFIYNFFIILSMRTICVSFLQNPTGQTYAATVIRRIIRMVIIVCVGSGLATAIFSQIGVEFIDDFKAKLPNNSMQTPVKVYNAIAAWNSLFDLFWLTTGFSTQAANSFWPTQTLWVSSVIYFQSFTVYFLMVILPFTRAQWHIKGLFIFGLGSFWMEYWGWYSATGLFFADLAINSTLQSEFKAGLRVIADRRIPYWVFGTASIAAGTALKYTFVILPQFQNSLLVLHPYLDLSESDHRSQYAETGSYARLDDWFLIVGIMIMVELFDTTKRLLSLKPLLWLGERAFGIFVAQCIFFWTGGIKLWLNLHDEHGFDAAAANAVVFLVGLFAVAAFTELFHRLIDLPSRWLAKQTYIWLVN